MQQSKKIYCVVALFMALIVSHNIDFTNAKRYSSSGGNRKTSGGGTSRHPSSSSSGHSVTKPTYNTNSGSSSSNSHADQAKLSYPNYNSQPNPQNNNAPPIGWNVPKQNAGPPPVYSANNPVGGAKTNIHEAAPAYRPSNAAPPSYGSSNVHTPITATNAHSVQSGYPVQQMPAGASYYPSSGHLPAGATYHPAGSLPAGATYYPSGGHLPAGASYYPSGGHMPAGASYYPSGGHMPAGATYLPAGAALPAGATYYSQPPQSSSGLGFGSGLAAGAIGGALLGHALTPTQTRVVEQAPAGSGSSGGEDKVIIINNGPPGSVTTTSAGSGTTVINAGAGDAAHAAGAPGPAVSPNINTVPQQQPLPPSSGGDTSVPLAPMVDPVTNETSTASPGIGVEQQPAAPGGIVCVPVRVNETDPADNTKMIEVEKIACYPAPPAPPQADVNAQQQHPVATNVGGGENSAPLAPINSLPVQASQQMQQSPTQATLLPENSSMRSTNKAANPQQAFMGFILSSLMALCLTYSLKYNMS